MTPIEPQQSRTAEKIVICLDGTGNQMKANGHTNVATLFGMLDLSDPTKQIGYCDPGVGTMSAANARGEATRSSAAPSPQGSRSSSRRPCSAKTL